LTVWVVGAVAEVAGAISIRFNLSVNEVAVPAVLRAHPSGTFTENPLPLKATNTWLSGMSPGGFDSVATGLGGDEVDVCELGGALVGALADGALVVLAGPLGLGAEDPEPPQPDVRAAMVSGTVSRYRLLMSILLASDTPPDAR
jgi:hypothetical protein